MTHLSEKHWRDAGVAAFSESPHAKLHPVPIRAVTMNDGFWQPRMRTNRTASVPRLLELLESHGALDNFRRVFKPTHCERRGPLFTDSDVYKWMEAAALVLQSGDDAELAEMLDGVIDVVLAAQHDDGYLNTWYVDERVNDRFTNLPENHELYCAGHLFQAAIAHYRATGSSRLLDGATRFADYLCTMFGPDKPVQGHAGHPEIEMALVELYRTTSQQRYLDLAGYFLDGAGLASSDALAGHAVRQMYLCAGGADYVAETGDTAMQAANQRLWDDLITGKMYITGGVGSRYVAEAFGDPFELPNHRSYTETCAAIGNAMWNWRLLATTGDARHADLIERVLYNGFLSGVSLSGTDYFYVNPLASIGGDPRQPWYDVTCCPSNIQRTIAAIPGHLFSTSATGLYVHLYDNCRLDWHLADGTALTVTQQGGYPWDGRVEITVTPATPTTFDLNLRIPGWCRGAEVSVNGQAVDVAVEPGRYCRVRRTWQPGDTVTLEMAMPAVAMVADQRVDEDRHAVALMRGPIVYCAEGTDQPGIALDRVRLPIVPETMMPAVKVSHESAFLGGVTVLRVQAREMNPPAALYTPLAEVPENPGRPAELTAIPYYAWANRQPNPMQVWWLYD